MLFEPFQLGPHTLKNRLVALPVFTGYALPDGRVSDMLVEHYASLAASGVAMVVVANAAVAWDGIASSHNLRADRDDFIPGLSRVARAIKKRGALACLQLNHAGRFARTDKPLMPEPLRGDHLAFNVSSLRQFMEFFPLERRFRLTQDFIQRLLTWNTSMSEDDKERIRVCFGEAAGRACESGFDMVELHGATGYLLTQFLSGYTHKPPVGREHDLQMRTAFPLRVLREVKRRLPEGFPVGFRLLLREWVPDGIDLPEAIAFANALEKEGVGYLSPSVGTYNSMFLPEVRKRMARPAYLREDTAALARQVGVPTVLSGRILIPRIAERALSEGVAPLIGLGRVLRTDMEWIRKAQRHERVTVCVNCNTCLKRVILDRGFNCVRWPAWLRERIDLEQRLLTRDMFNGLWVVADERDAEALKATMPLMIPERHGISTTIVFLMSEENASGIGAIRDELVLWSTDMWQRRGYGGGSLHYRTIGTQDPLDETLCFDVDREGYGAILLARNRSEPWRERFLYRLRGKVVGLLGLNSRWSRVIVPVDLSPTTLLVLRLLTHSLLRNPTFSVDYVHVLQGRTDEAERRWEEFRKILGWRKHVRLRLLPPEGKVGEALLREIEAGGYGTIVMGKRGLSRIKRMLLGSVSAAVLHGLKDQSLILID
ncbi:MAG: universal stress protein [Deltaproteobacteria bacterium]|nr:universal stress protein [Deltaproteobacteria bacterium]